jgi:sortase A
LRARALHSAQILFLLFGIGALGYCLFEVWESRQFQARAERELDRAIKSKTVHAPKAQLTRGALIGSLAIPRLGLRVVVVEGVDTDELRHAAGHIPETSLPGEAGNVAIAAHRDTYFRPLKEIRPEDTIVVTTSQREYRYSVVSTQIVLPDNVGVLAPTSPESLTLVTCYPFYFVGAAPKRFIVKAVKVPEVSRHRFSRMT